MSNIYEEKAQKYKLKYLKLKQELEGGYIGEDCNIDNWNNYLKNLAETTDITEKELIDLNIQNMKKCYPEQYQQPVPSELSLQTLVEDLENNLKQFKKNIYNTNIINNNDIYNKFINFKTFIQTINQQHPITLYNDHPISYANSRYNKYPIYRSDYRFANSMKPPIQMAQQLKKPSEQYDQNQARIYQSEYRFANSMKPSIQMAQQLNKPYEQYNHTQPRIFQSMTK
jgi:hypothetical protein